MKILVALDGSISAEAVIEPAAKFAREARAEVYLVRVVEPSRVHSTCANDREVEEVLHDEFSVRDMHLDLGSSHHKDAPDAPQVVESFDQALERAKQGARDYLQQAAHRFDPLHAEVMVLVGNGVDEYLAEFAWNRQVDLIAMASHGRTGLARVVPANHADRMLKYGVAPVLIVPPYKFHPLGRSPKRRFCG
jgi:nucleotide-binding universal stress UspA family protein